MAMIDIGQIADDLIKDIEAANTDYQQRYQGAIEGIKLLCMRIEAVLESHKAPAEVKEVQNEDADGKSLPKRKANKKKS